MNDVDGASDDGTQLYHYISGTNNGRWMLNRSPTEVPRSLLGWHNLSGPEAVASTIGPPMVLIVFRLVALGFFIYATIATADAFSNVDTQAPITSTLSFIQTAIVTCYFGLGAIVAVLNRDLIKQVTAYRNNVRYAPLSLSQKLYWVLFEAIWVGACVVCVVYWSLLYTPGTHVGFADLTMHAFTIIALMLDFCLSRQSFALQHAPLVLIAVGGALLYVVIYHAKTGYFLYNFLDFEAHGPLWYVLTVVIAAAFFGLGWVFSLVKSWALGGRGYAQQIDAAPHNHGGPYNTLDDGYTMSV